jgi:hypothetical protein
MIKLVKSIYQRQNFSKLNSFYTHTQQNNNNNNKTPLIPDQTMQACTDEQCLGNELGFY